jgi:hypothetical protein
MNMQNQQEEFKEFQVFLYKFKDIQGLEFLLSDSRTFKDIQVLYDSTNPGSGKKDNILDCLPVTHFF